MGFDFSGFVLKAPRSALSNSTSTDEATNGVDRDFKPLSPEYNIPSPALVETSADQYRAAVLLRTQDPQTEYLLWASNTANLANSATFLVENDADVSFPTGTDPVVFEGNPLALPTGSNRAIIIDDAHRSILQVNSLVVRRGDTGDTYQLVGTGSFNPVSSVFTITDPATIVALGGGVSSVRGDTATEITYLVAAPQFWWSRNDQYETRFKWDGRTQRWRPLRGTPPRNLGVLLVDTEYTLSPAPTLAVGTYLPGDSAVPDSYAMVRIGSRPDASSVPVAEPVASSGFGGIKIVTVEELEDFDFATEPTLSGVVAQGSGDILWNPAFVDLYAGQTIFYSYTGFVDQEAVEPLGPLEDANLRPLFLAPIPGPTDYPFLRIGSRQPLEVLFAVNETYLAGLTLAEGQIGVALSTGRLRFSTADIAKADPEEAGFVADYLGANVFYDGVSLSRRPVPLRAPVQLVDSSGDPTEVNGKKHRLYIPDAMPTPAPGVSGVLFLPDGTGTIPNLSTDPGIRPGEPSGLVRAIEGPWDLVLFTHNGQIQTIVVVDDDDEIPFDFQIPRGTAYVDLRKGAGGSRVVLSKEDLQRFRNDPMFFLQAGVDPSVYASEAQMWSRVRDSFTLTGSEVFVFSVEGAISVWRASQNPGGVPTAGGGTFTAQQMAQSLAALTATGTVAAVNGRIVISTKEIVDGRHYGDIEIGFGPDSTVDLSGPAALGFLPGWKIRIAPPNMFAPPPDLVWMPDNGTTLGVFRSPFNLDGRKDDIPDVSNTERFKDVVLTGSISASPVFLLDRVPLEDVAGYDEGVFFQIQDGVIFSSLKNYDDLLYQFGEDKFLWADEHTEMATVFQPANNLSLGVGQASAQSFRLPGKGLRLSIGGAPFVDQTLGENFILPDDGDSGIAYLVDRVGPLVQLGGRGAFTEGSSTFTDDSSDIDFVALGVQEGYQLKVTQGDAQGTYIVTANASDPHQLQVSPSFLRSDGPVPWELYEGVSREEYDAGVVADAQYVQFNHLREDPFQVRVLSPLGDVPANATAQSANRLTAVLASSLANNRTISIRFGQDPGSPSASLVGLTQDNLGEIVNSGLNVPAPESVRFAQNAFSIRVGIKTYSFEEGNLIKIAGVLTFPLLGDIIEVQTESGLLNFGTDVFTQFDGQDAVYVELFLPPANLSPGFAEYRVPDGALNFSSADMASFGGTEVFLVEEMIANLDVTLNPIQGSFFFTTPLREFQIVETHYFQAENGSGDLRRVPVDPEDPSQGTQVVEVTEQLPLFVRLEVATPEGTGAVSIWSFNPSSRSVREDIEPALYVGSTLYNVGSSPTASFDFVNNRIMFPEPVDATSLVRITYAVLQAFGGEQTYTVSQPPVYRPPFRIDADRTRFTLEGDRTSDVSAGKLLRVAEFPFYIVSSAYDSVLDTTVVDFIPRTQLEAGSRNPGEGSLSLLSDIPLATALSVSAPDGFWVEVLAPFDPLNRGFTTIVFQANILALAVPGHLLEVGGFPFIIAASQLSSDGTRTQIDITSFFPTGFAFGQDTVKISVRPVYPPLPTQFLGRGAIVVEEGSELILFGEEDATGRALPGRTLRPSIDYQLNADDGSVSFLTPPQGALRPTQSLYLRHTEQRGVAPLLANDVVLNPRYRASFVHVEAPSEENNRLGKILRGTYTFANPDTFFYRTVPLLNYLQEVAEEVAQDIAAQLPSFGPAPAVTPPVDNATQGRLGLKAQLGDLEDTDRAARVFLAFYNEVIVGFEQIQETISGNIVGDRDGKFEFFVGHGKNVPPPGYEDAISGLLNPRNIFSEIFFGYNPEVTFLKRDPLVDPNAVTIDGDKIEGPYIDPDFLSDLQGMQRDFAKNDVDDIVLVSRTRKKLRFNPIRLEAFGQYRKLGSPNVFSRIFPERAEAFTLTDPGIGADLEAEPPNRGVYAFRKKVRRFSIKGNGGNLKIQLPKRASTFLQPIGEIGNPVLGTFQNIGDVDVRVRYPRARVYLYSPVGFPEVDAFLIGVPTFTAMPRPAVIATPLPLHEFPIGENGMPDFSQLAAQGGDLMDLSTGDPDLFTPPFAETDADRSFRPQITFGRPDGRISDVQRPQVVFLSFPPLPLASTDYTVGRSVFVGEVLLGCIITFATEEHTPGDTASLLTSGNSLLEVAEDPAAADAPIQLFRGDTIFITPTSAEIQPAADIDDPATNSQKEAQLEGLPGFRIGFDLGVDRPDGQYRDITLPSFTDPSLIGLKEILGQKPPRPMTYLEADVRFRNGRTEPAPIPALTGGFKNDSGDYSLPYLYAQNTELDQLGIVASSFQTVFADTLVPSAAYPDEIQGTDGQILATATATQIPAALLTSLDVTPVATAGAYTPLSGVGDVAPFDLLLMETGQDTAGLQGSSQGILSVGYAQGSASGSAIEPPRFVTPTALPAAAGDRIRYSLTSAMTFVNQGVLAFPPGMIVRRVGTVTQFDISQLSNAILVFNDGTPAALTGGLNNIFDPQFYGAVQDNVVTINLWTAPNTTNPAPVYLQSILIDFNNGVPTVTGDLGAVAVDAISADDERIYIDTGAGPFVSIALNPGWVPPILPEDPSNPGNTIPLWFTIDLNLTSNAGAGGASTTGYIEQDRLTLNEALDLRTLLPRDEPDVDGVAVASQLNVAFVASQTTDDCTVNAMAETNGGVPFSFVARNLSAPRVGTFDPAPAGTGRGTVRVMGFEGHGNTTILTTEAVTFSVIPSSTTAAGVATPIASGTGIAGTSTDRNFRISSDGVILFDATVGALSAIQAGDVCVISGSSDATPRASTKAGTYLVKHVVEPNGFGLTASREMVLETRTAPFNSGTGWADILFPNLVSSNITGAGTLEISRTTLDDGTSAWPVSGTLYLLTQTDPNAGDYGTANFSVDYLNVAIGTNTFQTLVLSASSFDGSIAGIAAAVAIDALPVSTIVTGFNRFDVKMERATNQTLPRNTVGFDSGATTAVGFRYLTLAGSGSGSGSQVFTFGGGPAIVIGAPAADEIGVFAATPIANTSFVDNENAYVYEDVPQYLELNLTGVMWDSIHAASAAGVAALLPGDALSTVDVGALPPTGFLAQAGLFLEPSWPRPTLDLAALAPRVVDASHSVVAGAIGFRNGATFGEGATEGVFWEIRRIRRFHDVLQNVGDLLGPLRYVYEIRRGTITTYGTANVGPEGVANPFVVQSNGGTQLGAFNDNLVNVNPGDIFRLLDNDGTTVLEEIEIGGIESENQIWLKAPGITALSAAQIPGRSFQIYLKQVPVPHEQSNEQLFAQITQTVLLNRQANLALQEGGIVPVGATPTDPRKLQDTDTSLNYAGLGIQAGDIVLIDPAGELVGPGDVLPPTGQERGTRTFGDRSVPSRTVATPGQEVPFIPGQPSQLDDNRGWYRITEVSQDALTVSSETPFSADPGAPFVIFGDVAEYAVLPTISGSTAPFADPPGGPGLEGQMDLRPTALAGEYGSPPNSFLGNLFSIGPLSYRVFRPNTLFSEEAVDLVLLMRERTLSFLEEFRVFFDETKYGNYFIFQKDEHISDLGNPLIPDEGKGVMSNEFIDGVRGMVSISPYANTTDGLSVLDRRFWGLDTRLDSAFPPSSAAGTPSYATLASNANNPEADAGDGRPVLPDLIDDVLNNNDQFRELRLAWLDFRVNREDGTLESIARFEDALPKKRRKELRQLRLAKSVEDAES